jgi:archaellum component FlaF (FlaF/FlaG flagellin family)
VKRWLIVLILITTVVTVTTMVCLTYTNKKQQALEKKKVEMIWEAQKAYNKSQKATEEQKAEEPKPEVKIEKTAEEIRSDQIQFHINVVDNGSKNLFKDIQKFYDGTRIIESGSAVKSKDIIFFYDEVIRYSENTGVLLKNFDILTLNLFMI